MLFGKTDFANTDSAQFALLDNGTSPIEPSESWIEYCSPTKVWVEPAEDKRNIIRCQDGN